MIEAVPDGSRAYRCCVCGGRVNYTFWVCSDCRRQYGLGGAYADWPEWAKMAKNSEKRRRDYGARAGISGDSLRYAPYAGDGTNRTYRKANGIGRRAQGARLVAAPSLFYSGADDNGEPCEAQGSDYARDRAQGQRQQADIETAMLGMPWQQRRPLELDAQGATQAEIAADMGISQPTAGRLLKEARARMSELLSSDE